MRLRQNPNNVHEWRKRVKLFEGGIDPHDVGQGSVGDCWLIAAFACAAEHPGLLQGVFQLLLHLHTGERLMVRCMARGPGPGWCLGELIHAC